VTGRIFRCVWFIDDLDRTQAELRAVAETDLPDLLFAQHVQPCGEPRWRIDTESDGSSWLVLDLPVLPWADPVRHGRRRATTPTGRAR
jgi:hypothetical protein